MKISHIISSLDNGGAEKFVVELSNEQSVEHEVMIVSLRKVESWMLPPKQIGSNVKFIQLGKKKGFDILVLFKLLMLVIKTKPDVVNIHLNATLRYCYLVSLFITKPKYFFTIHSNFNSGTEFFFNQIRNFPLYRKRIKHICIAESIYNDFSLKYKRLKFDYIMNGIKKLEKSKLSNDVAEEVEGYKETSNTKILLAVGSFTQLKNFPMLVNVVDKLQTNKEDVKLLIIGGIDGEIKSEEYDICLLDSPNVILLGSKLNVSDYMFCADALIISSIFEGTPLVALEAMSVGLPVITTPVGGLIDIIKDKVNGFISEAVNEESLYKAISEYLSTQVENLEFIKKNSVEFYKSNLTIEICAMKYISLYES